MNRSTTNDHEFQLMMDEKSKKIVDKNPFVSIRLRPYLRDWVINNYGVDAMEPVLATQGNKLFPFISSYLTKVPEKYKEPIGKEYLRIYLPFNNVMQVRNLQYIDKDHYAEIQSFFYGRFYTKFILYMNDHYLKHRFQIKPSIIKFCEENNINFDYANFDSLKRIYSRYRNDDGHEN